MNALMLSAMDESSIPFSIRHMVGSEGTPFFSIPIDRNLVIKNRFIRSSIGDHTPGGRINQMVIDKYRAQVGGGVSTVITGFTLVDEAEKDADIARIYDDSFIPENKELVDTIHAAGANAIMQLVYLGSDFRSEVLPEHVLSAIDVPDPYTGLIPEVNDFRTSNQVRGFILLIINYCC